MVFHLEGKKPQETMRLIFQKGGSWGWRRAHCRNAHVLHCLLKIILSADLLPFLKLGSITKLSYKQSKFWKRQKLVQDHGKTKKKHPMSPVQLLLRPSHGSKLFVFFGFLEVFATLAQKCLKTHAKTKKKVSPNVACPASPQTLSMGRNFLFFFLEVFATVSVQQYQLLMFFVFFCFPVSWAPGRNFHPDKHPLAQLSPLHSFILMSLLSYWFWLLSHERKCTVKTALSPTSSGTPLDWCFTGMPRFWFLIFKGLARVLQTWNH